MAAARKIMHSALNHPLPLAGPGWGSGHGLPRLRPWIAGTRPGNDGNRGRIWDVMLSRELKSARKAPRILSFSRPFPAMEREQEAVT